MVDDQVREAVVAGGVGVEAIAWVGLLLVRTFKAFPFFDCFFFFFFVFAEFFLFLFGARLGFLEFVALSRPG